LFYPESRQALLEEDDATVTERGEDLVKVVRKALPFVNHYVCAAMLCEYRKAFEDGSEYPARTQDAELGHFHKFLPYWQAQGFRSNVLAARREIFDARCLGEVGGWKDVRKPLEKVLSEHGYNWSDTVFDYLATKDFHNPQRRRYLCPAKASPKLSLPSCINEVTS
jgi:hypothetical protein